MSLRLTDDGKRTAIDEATGISLSRQGRADAGEFPVRVVDPAYPDENERRWSVIPVRFLDEPVADADEAARLGAARKPVGYGISDVYLRAALRRQYTQDTARYELIRQLLVEYLELTGRNPGRPIKIEFLPE